MASIITPANATTDLAVDGVLTASVLVVHECAFCRSPILAGQRWVREKIYEPAAADNPRYRRYHADLFAGQNLCCWEKHETELEIGRAARTALRIM